MKKLDYVIGENLTNKQKKKAKKQQESEMSNLMCATCGDWKSRCDCV